MEIRRATIADAPALARVHVAAWRSAYVGVMPDAYLADLDEARFSRGWVSSLEDRVATTLVGISNDGRVGGFASTGPARDKVPGVTGELWALNLHPVAIGSGLAMPLHRAALDSLASAGHASVYLWVVRDNPRARRFYQREGWTADGSTQVSEYGGAPLHEVRYVRGVL